MKSCRTVGLVGLGAWGTKLLRQLNELGVDVVCYPGRTQASRDRVSSVEGVRSVGSLEALLVDTVIDAIVIATPPASHASLAQLALRAGHHTRVEKPLCLTTRELDQILELASSNGCVLQTGYTVSSDPVVLELARLAHAGRLRSIWSSRTKTGSFGADIVSTHMVHEIAIADRLTGGLSTWEVAERAGAPEDPDAVTLSYGSDTGASGIARVDRVSPGSRRELGMWVDDRVYRWDGRPELLEFHDGEYRSVFSRTDTALAVELREFLQAVDGGPTTDGLERERRLAGVTIGVRDAVLA